MSIGKRIKDRRQALGLTQQNLAEAIGITAQHVSVMEQDKRTPSLPSLARLAAELGVTIDYIVTGKDKVTEETIPAIKADNKLSLRSKNALVELVKELYGKTSGK